MKKDTTNNVCLLFQGSHAHPAHQTFADAVGADYRHFETGRRPTGGFNDSDANQNRDSVRDRIRTGLFLSTEYDIVIAEGTAPLHTLLVYASARNRSVKSLYLAADETFYTLDQRPTRWLWKGILGSKMNHILDGCIAVGTDVYEWARPYVGNLPVRVVHPPITDRKHTLLSDVQIRSPQNEFVILSAGAAKPANNYDSLARAGSRLRVEKGSHVKVVILGEGHDEQPYANYDGVETPGFVPLDAFKKWFECASVYVQSSTGDSFPVASLEGMLSGTPTITTESVGTRHIIPSDHVSGSRWEELLDTLKQFHGMDEQERVKFGTDQRKSVLGITESAQAMKFRRAVEELT